jgi:hypothetical protein
LNNAVALIRGGVCFCVSPLHWHRRSKPSRYLQLRTAVCGVLRHRVSYTRPSSFFCRFDTLTIVNLTATAIALAQYVPHATGINSH